MTDVVNRLILQVADCREHPLGPTLLDEYLRRFPSPAARDAVWSLPKAKHGNVVAAMYEERHLLEHMPRLHPENNATQMPLLFSWALASVSNLKRSFCRSELVIWGMNNPDEFALLFKRFCSCDDPQIREDIFAIAAEVVCQGKQNPDAEKAMGRAALDSVFKNPDKPGNRDAAIRHFGRLLVERCHNDGLLSDGEAHHCLPPYAIDQAHTPLPIYADACGSDRNSGFWPIHYDLSRYVLIYHLEKAFGLPYHGFLKHQENAALNQLIDASAELAGIPRPEFDGWVIGATYQYLLNYGYDPSVFETRTLQDGTRVEGIDSTIVGTYYHADHGSRSDVMTVSEKYVWCARNEICGYMADRLPISSEKYDDNGRHETTLSGLTHSYSCLLDFDSPLLEASYERTKRERDGCVPCFPDEFACNHESTPCTKDELRVWIDETSPDIGTALLQYSPEIPISIDAQTIPINLYALDWGLCGKECVVWANAGVARSSEMEKLESARSAYINGYDLSSCFEVGFDGSGGAVYLSPVEILSSSENIELDETNEVEVKADACINAKPLSGEGVSRLTDVGDYWYLFPSSLAREMCGIAHTNGAVYSDDGGVAIFEDVKYGIPYRRYYSALLADRRRLLNALQSRGLCLLWHLTVRRNANSLARERLDDQIESSENSWLAWLDDGCAIRTCPISHERIQKEEDFTLPDFLKELTEKYDGAPTELQSGGCGDVS